MENNQEKIIFTTDDETIEFYVLEQTKLNGIDYILVTDNDNEEEEAEVLILKDVSEEQDEEAIYEAIEDEKELMLIAKIFEETMEDIDIEI